MREQQWEEKLGILQLPSEAKGVCSGAGIVIESNYNSKNNISMANEVDKTKLNIMSVP